MTVMLENFFKNKALLFLWKGTWSQSLLVTLFYQTHSTGFIVFSSPSLNTSVLLCWYVLSFSFPFTLLLPSDANYSLFISFTQPFIDSVIQQTRSVGLPSARCGEQEVRKQFQLSRNFQFSEDQSGNHLVTLQTTYIKISNYIKILRDHHYSSMLEGSDQLTPL